MNGSSSSDSVTTREEFDRADGRAVEAVGVYEAVAKPRKGPPDPSAPRDHAVIVLADGTRVWIEPTHSPSATRSEQERRRLDGRRTRAAGTARRRMPAKGASLIAPCLQDVRSVELAP
jgi:hypothetical protein